MPKRQIPFLSSVLRGDIQNFCKFESQSPDNMTIVNKLLYIDSYYLTSMVIFSNVLKRWFSNNFLAKSCFKTTFHHRSLKYNFMCSFLREREREREKDIKNETSVGERKIGIEIGVEERGRKREKENH